MFRSGEKNPHSSESPGRLGKQPGKDEGWRQDSKPDSPSHPAETQGKGGELNEEINLTTNQVG